MITGENLKDNCLNGDKVGEELMGLLAAVIGEGVEGDFFCTEDSASIDGGGGDDEDSEVCIFVDLTDLEDLELLKYLKGLIKGWKNLE